MHSFEHIEFEARTLLSDMDKHKAKLWPHTPPPLLYMCNPEVACHHLGLRYLPDSHLGSLGGTATAGMLDRRRGAVLLSSRQSYEALRFTAAHEVGHFVLHPGQLLFRDRSLNAHGGEGRPAIEQEADIFAACFLMPPKLLREAFFARFPLREPITNTGAICYNLSMRDGQYLEGLPAGSMEFALAVARAESFNGRRFESLCHLFSVSPTAMAIRLEQAGLVH